MASNPLSTLGTIFVNNENQGTTMVVSDLIGYKELTNLKKTWYDQSLMNYNTAYKVS